MKKILKWFGIAFAVVLVLSIIGAMGSNGSSSNVTSSNDSTSFVASDSEVSNWEYEENIDEMTNTKSVYVSLSSINTINQDFPYGPTNAQICVRKTKKSGVDVLFMISQGQIIGNSFDGSNYVNIKFDDGQPKKYRFSETSDGSSETIFLNNTSEFIKNAKSAKKILVEVTLYQAGNNVFKFETNEPLKW